MTKHTRNDIVNRGLLAVLCVVCVGGCATPGDETTAEEPSLAAFPAVPADGPMPEMGPAPDGYRPTAAGSPSTDIWVATLVRDGQALTLSEPANATDRDGYDNQPSFLPDGEALLYVAALDQTQTEVFRVGSAGEAPQRVTRTETVSEFSPTPIPGQDAFSAIHEIRGKQYLWRYGVSGSDLGPIFSTAEPVGYHAWATDHVVAMFILGDPATLQVGDALSGEIRVVAERPGRSIHRIPGSVDISFVRKMSDDEWWIERLDPATGATTQIVQTLPGREDYAWTPRGEILMGDGATLHRWTSRSGWSEIADLSSAGVQGITRLAVSPDGSRIAIVSDRP